MKCVICGGKIFGYGHNAAPVAFGTCCEICNDTKVIPARLSSLIGYAGAGDVVDSDGSGDGGGE